MGSKTHRNSSINAHRQRKLQAEEEDGFGTVGIAERTRSHFRTTNQEFNQTLDPNSYSANKKNFKKKTPLTQWSNAYFSGGVFFNPPVNGI